MMLVCLALVKGCLATLDLTDLLKAQADKSAVSVSSSKKLLFKKELT